MPVGKFNKTPNEVKRYSIDYSDWLDTAEYVSSVSFTVTSNSNVPLTVIADTIAANSTTVAFFVSGGAVSQVYDVTVRTVTTASQTKEDVVVFNIRAAA